MAVKLWSAPGEREQALLVAAGVVVHALVSHHGAVDAPLNAITTTAFDLAEKMLAEAEKRCR